MTLREHVALAMFMDYCSKIGDRSRNADPQKAWSELSPSGRDNWLIRADVAIQAYRDYHKNKIDYG